MLPSAKHFEDARRAHLVTPLRSETLAFVAKSPSTSGVTALTQTSAHTPKNYMRQRRMIRVQSHWHTPNALVCRTKADCQQNTPLHVVQLEQDCNEA
jgi:hypothetical protein